MSTRVESGSFRDPDSRVFYADDAVLRALSPQGRDAWVALRDSGLLERLVADGMLVESEEVAGAAMRPDVIADVATVLRHSTIPFVSYPYEWSFSMLRDAALLQLELLDLALAEDLTLKDATPYNVQFSGAHATFIDVGSFERYRPGDAWLGYRQFCMSFLYPLMLQAFRGVPFQPWLRGNPEGISPDEFRRLLGLRDRFRRGVLTHVVLHARLERRSAGRHTARDASDTLRRAGFRKELIVANVRRLRKLVARLPRNGDESAWTTYADGNTYTEADRAVKDGFVRDAVHAHERELVWDIGCNDGRYARIAAENARYVVALDADAPTVDRLYRDLSAEAHATILPLAVNVLNPSPAQGWQLLERRSLADRGAPDLVLALALVHHLSITGNVPLREVVGWLRSLEATVVVEFPSADDPMVHRLLQAKRPGMHADYTLDWFTQCLAERFRIERTMALPSGTRTLHVATPAG